MEESEALLFMRNGRVAEAEGEGDRTGVERRLHTHQAHDDERQDDPEDQADYRKTDPLKETTSDPSRLDGLDQAVYVTGSGWL